MPSAHAADSMGVGDYKDLLRRQWIPVLLCLLLGIGAAVAYIQLAPREYRAQTSVLVTPVSGPTSPTPRNTALNLETEAQLVTSTQTVAAAAELLDVPEGEARSLLGHVDVEVPPSSEILEITFAGETAKAAQQGAQAFAQAYLDQREETSRATLTAEDEAIQARIDDVTRELTRALRTQANQRNPSAARSRTDAQVAALNNQLTNLGAQQNALRSTSVTPGRVVTEAALPTSPSSPDPLVALVTGALLGLLIGLAVAALRHRADDTIRSPEDLHRRTRIPVTAVLPTRLSSKRISLLPPLSPDGRAYARLRNLVTTRLEETSRPVVLVAGVRRGGGPVAANLAASLARAGEDVVLVCADVFGDTAAALLGRTPAEGLAEVLAGSADVHTVVGSVDGLPTLRILGSGRDPDRADALLQTRSPRRLVDRLLESAAYVVIEAPSTTDSPDAQTLANVAELAIVVVETGSTSAREVVDAGAQLESMGTPVLGAVLVRYGRDGADGSTDRQPLPEASSQAADDVAPPTAGRTQPIKPVTTLDSSPARSGDPAELVPPGSRDHAPR